MTGNDAPAAVTDALPPPYYADALVTLYLGDCRELLPFVRADVAVFDPPYGIAWSFHGGGRKGKMAGTRIHDGIEGDADTSLRDAVLGMLPDLPAAVFGSFQAPFPAGVRQVLIYRKSPDAGLVGSVTGFRRDAEPIFLVGPWPRRGALRSSVLESHTGLQRLQAVFDHPHAKPLDVLVPLLAMCPPGTILDPFVGSGSTLVAAKLCGRRAIGIEIEERYCEMAAQRCAQEVLGLSA
jgi:site-specific DNA-methyltransferase (adenine-specific)